MFTFDKASELTEEAQRLLSESELDKTFWGKRIIRAASPKGVMFTKSDIQKAESLAMEDYNDYSMDLLSRSFWHAVQTHSFDAAVKWLFAMKMRQFELMAEKYGIAPPFYYELENSSIKFQGTQRVEKHESKI